MMYSGMFVRGSLGQMPNNGLEGWTTSPDIIFAGLTPPADPAQYTTALGYATDYGSTVTLNQANFVYLRALNTTSGPLTASAWLYYAESDVLLWPKRWQSAGISVGGNATNYQWIEAKAGSQVCATGAYVWTPPPLRTATSHYCTVAWMENPPVQPPPWTPLADIPNFSTYEELANFVCTHPNMAMRNTVDVSQAGPSWQRTTAITGASGGGPAYVGVVCHNMPTDGSFAFSVAGAGSVPSLNYPKTRIANADETVTMPVNWPSDFVAAITISYWEGATPPPPDASIALTVIIAQQQVAPHAVASARKHAPWRFRAAAVSDADGTYTGHIAGVIIGSVVYQF